MCETPSFFSFSFQFFSIHKKNKRIKEKEEKKVEY